VGQRGRGHRRHPQPAGPVGRRRPGQVACRAQPGHSHRTTSARGRRLVGPTWASTSALAAVGVPHSGHGRAAGLAAVTVDSLGRCSGGQPP
jgi:hypothetical protein